jgi:hypothetical protein
MDNLISTLKNFKLGLCGIDEIIDKLDNLSTYDSNYEWELLVSNYSKMKYLKKMEDELKSSVNLLKSLSRFMEQIDKVTQYYLKMIDWNTESKIIEDFLLKSLNFNDPFQKMDYVIKAYDILIPIIEDYNKEKHIEQIDDPEFLKIFKKRKLNVL